MSAICFGEATGFIRKVGKDEEGLGKWSWILFAGSDGQTTRLITAYNPCKVDISTLGHRTSSNDGILSQRERT